ncbi:MAG: alpha/beta hydrolase [Brevefilum sp.]
MKVPGLLPRDFWVWTPPEYEKQPKADFPVIYMHDGQNLFFPEKSYTHITWGVAEVITRLSNWGFIQPAIVVGIDNTKNRMGDYLPSRPFKTPEGQAYINKLHEQSVEELKMFDFVADKYLKLIVKEIKPLVDRTYRTRPEQKNTFILGSSMGGLISLYALVEYPEIFGGAGCFSTHWPILAQFTTPYLRKYLPVAGSHKLYFDYGTGADDAQYAPYQKEVDQVMQAKGYTQGVDWITRIAPGAIHHEQAWRSRIHLALRFFLYKPARF